MAKNITIAEGGVSRNFTAKKLKTNLQGGGNCTWVPEDEAADYCTFKELKVTANGTYKASDKNCDGFDKVKVEVPSDVLPQKTITTNGEYDAMQDDGRMGYAHVTVNVPGGGGGPFTVIFLDDEGNVLKKQENVPYGGYASCTALDGTIRNGLYFKGWNPVPKNVQFNMTCRPVRGDYVITPGEIADDWETIVADGGAHYPLGSYKTLVCEVPAHLGFQHVITGEVSQGVFVNDLAYSYYDGVYPDIPVQNVACHMVKVAEGEDSSTSTWLSDNFISFNNLGLHYWNYRSINSNTQYVIRHDWLNSPIRRWLNEDLFSALPDPIKNSIVDVNKTTRALSVSPAGEWARPGASGQMVDKTSIDSIWVPSMKEFHIVVAAAQYYSGYTASEELSGIDYSTVFVPIFTNNMSFRTLGSWENGDMGNMKLESAGASLNNAMFDYSLFGFCL